MWYDTLAARWAENDNHLCLLALRWLLGSDAVKMGCLRQL